jgi:transcriptional regulator with XRE-family HTH domain
VTHPAYIRDKARQMRAEKDLTIDEIAERLAVSRQTVFHWVRDLPLQRARRRPDYASRAVTNSLRYKALRDEAYEAGFEQFDELVKERTFRDFVCMYIGEGSKRNRNELAICNSDPNVILLAEYWMRRFARKPLLFSLQYHADQDLDELKRFWGRMLYIDPQRIATQRKSNSNQLTGRQWRSRHGVLAVRLCDTYVRARLQAWMDRIAEEWLDLPVSGRSAAW